MSQMTDKAIGITREVAHIFGDTAAKAVDVSKGYARRAVSEAELRKKIYELGRICYEMYCSGTDNSGLIKAKIEEIKETEAHIRDAKESTGVKVICPVCGAQNTCSNTFCSKCGTHLNK
ncbi:MAG: zinc-ribbon domain-containing protein [Oscillospiraceae bacterium]|nr:zinc-ribbon domain-containing protein [Oscillospiraceae bacterium]